MTASATGSGAPLPDFAGHVAKARPGMDGGGLCRGAVTTLQVNLTARCNLACHHCHVESGPRRTETLGRRAADRVLALLKRNPQVTTLDLTGGAPEMNAEFRRLVEQARALDRQVIDRCNLTIFYEPGYEDLPEFLARHDVEIVASLPCYGPENVEAQRGRGVFDRSIAALQHLNALGYGAPDSPRRLHLVYNPLGARLPPVQTELETQYREALGRDFGIRFHSLYTLTNMPIKRFARDLERDGESQAYMSLLVNHFNPDTIEHLMCRSLISVGWDGRIYDCDFNQALEIAIPGPEKNVSQLGDLSELEGRPIATAPHCFGCTAGAGSSCGGSLR